MNFLHASDTLITGVAACFTRESAERSAMVRSALETGSPARAVVLFHESLAAGRPDDAADVFAFAAAYRLWADVSASYGMSCPAEVEFRNEVRTILSLDETHSLAASYDVAALRHLVIGDAASVVFEIRRRDSSAETGVATAAMEDGVWRVRTYPAVFPGRLLAALKSAAGAVKREMQEE